MSDNQVRYDCHHIFFQKRFYKKGYLYQLRKHPYCRLSIPRENLHKKIHIFVGSIPVPKCINAKEALEHLRRLEYYGAISMEDDLVKRLTVLIALFDVAEPDTTEALKLQLKIASEFYDKPP